MPADHKLAIDELMGKWNDTFGQFLSGFQLSPQVISAETVLEAKLRGFDVCPTRFLGAVGCEIRTAIQDLVRDTASELACGIIVCLTDEAFSHVRQTSILPKNRAVVLSRQDLGLVLQEKEYLFQCIRKQVSIRRLIPFSVSEPTQGAMFVGRQNELRSLVDENQDFALCGIGGIGKSSLLHQMQWTLRRERSPRASRIVVVDLITFSDLNAAAAEIAWRVHPSRRSFEYVDLTNLDLFLRHVKHTDIRFKDGPIDLVIDEADAILDGDRHSKDSNNRSYPLMRCLRLARHQGIIRLTISGRTMTKKLLESPDNPFTVEATHTGKSISRLKLLDIEPLSETDARKLLIEPLLQLGFTTQKSADELLAAMRSCDGIPFQIQKIGLDLANKSANQLESIPKTLQRS